MDVPILWLIVHQLLGKTGWWLSLGCSQLRWSGATQRSEKTPWLPPAHGAEQWSVHPLITNAVFMVTAPFLTIMKCALRKKTNTSTLLDTETENQRAFPLDCTAFRAKEDSDPRDHCKVVTPSSQGSHRYETHIGWMMQSQS